MLKLADRTEIIFEYEQEKLLKDSRVMADGEQRNDPRKPCDCSPSQEASVHIDQKTQGEVTPEFEYSARALISNERYYRTAVHASAKEALDRIIEMIDQDKWPLVGIKITVSRRPIGGTGWGMDSEYHLP